MREGTFGNVGAGLYGAPAPTHKTARVCRYEGCGRKHDSLGYCARHAQLLRRGEDLRPLKAHLGKDATLRERLDYRTDKSGNCWVWTGALAGGGYGYLRYKGRALRAHRVAFELENGPIAHGLEIDHKCRNRSCVRPSHLQAVSSMENSENMGVRVDSRTGFRGVTFCKRTNKYAASFYRGGVLHWGGRHSTLEEAVANVRQLRNALCTNNLIDKPDTGFLESAGGRSE